MRYLLDTNTCIRFLNARAPRLIERLTQTPDKDICVCSVVKAEMFFGAQKSRQRAKTRSIQEQFLSRYHSLVFDDKAADSYAIVRVELERQGKLIGPNDLMIAAIALANGCILVSANEDEFRRVPDLRLENWER